MCCGFVVCPVDTRCDEGWCSSRIVQWSGTSKRKRKIEKGYSMGGVCMNNLSAMLWLVCIVYGSKGACCSYDALLYVLAGCSWLVRASLWFCDTTVDL